jgi:hypothetical protein
MPTWTQDDATCEVFTFKAGLLSAVGHDLLLRCNQFTLTYDEDTVHGTFNGLAMEVVGAMKNGEVHEGALSEQDCVDILNNIRTGVFKRHEAAEITFVCDDLEEDDGLIEGEGTLTIPPNEHDIDFELSIDGDTAVCEVTLHQPDWGIAPFKALMGTLRIQPDVKVRITVPWTS